MSFQHTPQTVITATVGSHAYGLANEHSDVDTMRVIVQPTSRLVGINKPPEPVTHRTDPDVTEYELGHLIGLLLKSNPTVTEILWLPEDCYRDVSALGRELIEMRSHLLSAKHVREAYMGYVNSQVKLVARLADRDEVPYARIAKAQRHIVRLTVQAESLWETGEMTVRPPRPDLIREAAENMNVDQLAEGFERLAEIMKTKPTPLQETVPESGLAMVNDWLLKARFSFF